ncbi:MAG: tail fiber domain-containing protein [Patescibacteria group bacterium]
MTPHSCRKLIAAHYPKLLSGFFFTILFSSYLSTFAIGSPYQPGETLDPACPPGEINCIVQIIPDQTGHAGEYLTTDGTVTSWGIVNTSNAFIQNGNSFGSLATLGTNDANALVFETNNTERVRITSGGNMGVGTNPATFKLEVAGNLGPEADNTRDIGSVSQRWANIYATNIAGAVTPTGFTQGSIPFAGTGGTLSQNNALLFWNNTSGFMGIGRNNPSYRLDVLNNTTAQTTTNRVANFSNAASTFNTTAGVLTNYTGYFANTATRSLGSNALTNVGLYSTASGAQNNYAAIFDAGNVGIGTSSPVAKLQVEGGHIRLGFASDIETSYGGFYIGRGAGDPSYGMQLGSISGTNGTRLFSYSIASIAFTSTTTDLNNPIYTDLFLFTNGGKLLINSGTSSSSASNLVVNGSAVIGLGYLNNTAPPNGLIVQGNVGIGTASPGAKLDLVEAGTAITSTWYGYHGTNAGSTFNTTAGALTSYLSYFNNTSTRATGSNALTNVGLYASASGAQNNYAGIFESGNVGIGDTSPLSLLSVGANDAFQVNSSGAIVSAAGLTTTGAISLTSANTTQVTTASAFALNANSLTTGTGLYAASSTLTSGKLVDLQVSGTAAAAAQTVLNILNSGATATNAITTYGAQISNTRTNATSGTNVALYLNASGATTNNYGLIVNAGNVGIGTTAPNNQLHVEGSSSATAGTGVFTKVVDTRTSGNLRLAGYSFLNNTITGQLLVATQAAPAPFNSQDGLYLRNATGGSSIYMTLSDGSFVESKAFALSQIVTAVGAGYTPGSCAVGGTYGGCPTLFGYQTVGPGVAIGYKAQATNAEGTAIGPQTKANGLAVIAIGDGAWATPVGPNGNETIIGDAMWATGNINYLIGGGIGTAHDYVVAFGAIGNSVNRDDDVATADHQGFFGAYNSAHPLFSGGAGFINDWYWGPVRSAAPHDITWNMTAASGTDKAGIDLRINASAATGNAIPGRLIFQTSTVTTSGTTLQTLTPRMVIDGSGFVGIAQPAPLYLLHVGSASVTTGTTVARFQNAGGTCDVVPSVAAGISCTSDENLKKNIQALNDSTLEKVLRLRPVSYNMRVEGEGSPLHIGFVAQELESIFPDLVRTDAQGFKSVSYAGLTPYIVKAVQEMELRTRGLPEFEDTSAAVKVAEFLRGVAEGVARTQRVETREVATDKLCVGTICVTQEEFLRMVNPPASTSSGTPTTPDPDEEVIPPPSMQEDPDLTDPPPPEENETPPNPQATQE